MGRFDCAESLGKKIFGDDHDPAEKIKQQIERGAPQGHFLRGATGRIGLVLTDPNTRCSSQ
jgi:hypothetical protein